MREEDAGRYQMLWDCPACETPKLLGIDHRHCPNCGNPQDPKRRYFPPEGEEIAVNDHAYHGADLKCPACETPCSAVANNCGACGAGLDAAKSVEQRSEQIRGERDDFAKDTAKTAKTDFKAQKAGGQDPAQPAAGTISPAAARPFPEFRRPI